MLMLLCSVVLTCLPACAVEARSGAADDKKEPKEPYVEIDFAPMPCEEMRWTITVMVETTDKDLTYTQKISGKMKRYDLCEAIVSAMGEVKFKAEVVDKSKVRVYGRVFNDKLIPVTKGSVTSTTLEKDQLPTVKYVGRKL